MPTKQRRNPTYPATTIRQIAPDTASADKLRFSQSEGPTQDVPHVISAVLRIRYCCFSKDCFTHLADISAHPVLGKRSLKLTRQSSRWRLSVIRVNKIINYFSSMPFSPIIPAINARRDSCGVLFEYLKKRTS